MLSVGLIVYLFYFMEEITPDFFHFVTCFEPIYGHYIWVFIIWSTYKVFFDYLEENTAFSLNADTIITIGEILVGTILSG